MNDSVTVTLHTEQSEKDYSLPVSVPLKELYARLIPILEMENGTPSRASSIQLKLSGRLLDDESATLAEYGITDGTYLDIECI